MIAIIDMGTTNTRIYSVRDGKITDTFKIEKGGRHASNGERAGLFAEIGKKLDLFSEKPESVYVYGMGGSEYGICEAPHIELPINGLEMSKRLNRAFVPEITDAPIYVIPGVFYKTDDVFGLMRSEETEALGFIASGKAELPCTLVLPGSHCKGVHINENGEIVSFSSCMTGEMLKALSENTILNNAVKLGVDLCDSYLIKGALSAKNYGLNETLLKIRTMQYRRTNSVEEMTSYFTGAVLYNDVASILRTAVGKIYVGGKAELQKPYITLIDFFSEKGAYAVEDAENLGVKGVLSIIDTVKRQETKEAVKASISENKIIVIIRGLKRNEYLPTVEALYKGGIRLVEIPFDALGRQSDDDTADIIRELAEKFRGKMFIGAGSVLKPEQVQRTRNAGGTYIISPNSDENVINESIKLSMVSIPGCFTPSETVKAYNMGADFIKIFPNDLGKEKYIKAVHVPLPHIPLLAVGGVNEDNLCAMLSAGAKGVGLASLFIDKALIAEGNFDEITARAARCVKLVEKF